MNRELTKVAIVVIIGIVIVYAFQKSFGSDQATSVPIVKYNPSPSTIQF